MISKNKFRSSLGVVIIGWLLGFSTLLEAQTTIRDSSFVVRTQGKMAHLNYGTGTDRLGGAKMGYIDSLVLLRVTGQYEDQYRVRLTPSLSAWVPINTVKPDNNARIPVQYLTGSWRVWGEAKMDYVSIILPERLPYQSWQELESSRVIVDVFGATTNTNWITQMQSAKEIKNVEYQQIADEHLRVIIYLKHNQHWGYSVGYQGRRLVIGIRHQPVKLKLNALTIAIDAGHGGTNLGAIGLRSKMTEKQLNLSIAYKLKKILERQGATVLLTRSADTLINNSDRVLVMKKLQPDLLVSIHNNAAGDTVKIKGTSTYYKHLGYRSLSQSVLKRLLELDLTEYGNVGRFNFAFNSPTEYPNLLVEGAFMSQAQDEQKLLNENFQEQMAQKIMLGLRDWLKKVRRKKI